MTTSIPGEALLAQLNWRCAIKAFDPERKIAPDDWVALEKALILTPTSYGFQPYRFVVITDQATRARLLPLSWGQRQVVDSSHLVVFAAKKSVNEADVDHYLARIVEVRGGAPEKLAGFRNVLIGDIVSGPRSEWQHEWATRQAYIALGNFMTAAAMLGIDTCPMEGIDLVKYDELLGLPAKGYHTVVAAAAGYRSDGDKISNLPKVRFPADELVIRIESASP